MSDGSSTKDKKTYKKTLNLPRTGFAMKANLVQREPTFQKRWDKLDVYARLREIGEGRPRFILHDGPPYANGSIHMGHLLNKVLKDLVVRSRNMLGNDVPFIPGWDCHGLPIEHRVLKNLGAKAAGMVPQQIRKRCQDEAAKFIKLQSRQMRRLGTVGDYDQPYKTMDPHYEAATLEVFARLIEKGLVFRALRPVHWSIANQTALADAELEYADREDQSVYVEFDLVDPGKLPESLGAPAGQPIRLMIWTTTPWTLPANLAVAVSSSAEYGLYSYEREGRTGLTVVASELASRVFGAVGVTPTSLGTCRGDQLAEAGIEYRGPLTEKSCPVVTADYVTLEDGTGLVHTAPGHGVEDYQTGKRLGLEIYCPVQADGTFDDSVPEWIRGLSVWDSNDRIVEHLRGRGRLFHAETFTHSYPHDWRSKTPVIFRATKQWFVAVDQQGSSLRGMALEQTASDVRFLPEWGRNRMRGMLESRPDWCISRQRSWGLPIPAMFGPGDDQVLLTSASVRAVAEQVRKHGSDLWFRAEAPELLGAYDPATDADAPDWVKQPGALERLQCGRDIFDVWFESGSSWHSVVQQRGLDFPVDLYLEGSDQHRGWFQLSLLLGLGYTDVSPFKAVLTHGFMVDRHGMKMSKSLGNTLDVDELIKDFGADIARWWVCSLNFENDIKVDTELMRLAGEEYRKVRNTIRFLLSNLGDYDNTQHRRELTEADADSIDAWAMEQLDRLVETVRSNFEGYRFRGVHDSIFNFCNDTLSSVYMAAAKDRLYCDRVDADRRRRTQTVMYDMADALIHLVAPILVHTADEAFLALRGENPDKPQSDDCVHLCSFPEPSGYRAHEDWPRAMGVRERVLKALEVAREESGMANPLDTGVRVGLPAEELAACGRFAGELADLCGVSRFVLAEADAESIEIDDLSDEPRCERSWKRDGTVKVRSDGGLLTDRDAEAVGV